MGSERCSEAQSSGCHGSTSRICSGSSIPASSVYNEEGILQISPASTNPQLTEQGFENVFRTCGRDDVQGIYAANYVVDNKVAALDEKWSGLRLVIRLRDR